MTTRSSTRNLKVVGPVIALTTLAELFCLAVWGTVLFPDGSWVGNTVWTLTGGLAMGAVVGSRTLLGVEGRFAGAKAFWSAAPMVLGIGAYCAWLYSRIDERFGEFGGSEHAVLFIWAGVLPAFLGGLLYGWIL